MFAFGALALGAFALFGFGVLTLGARIGGAESFHFRLAIFAHFLRRDRTVLILVDLGKKRFLSCGEFFLRNLAVLVGIGNLQEVNEGSFLAIGMRSLWPLPGAAKLAVAAVLSTRAAPRAERAIFRVVIIVITFLWCP